MKKNALFLFGGESSEHEISCISAYNVLAAVDTDLYNIYIIGITKGGEWYFYDEDIEKIRDTSKDPDVVDVASKFLSANLKKISANIISFK